MTRSCCLICLRFGSCSCFLFCILHQIIWWRQLLKPLGPFGSCLMFFVTIELQISSVCKIANDLTYGQSEIPLSSDDIIYYCQSRRTSERNIYGKQRICFSNSGSAHFHVSWLSDFIVCQKPLYKSLHQSFFYSFITIIPSESGVTLHYSTILPQIL